jgi:hypothetical protein
MNSFELLCISDNVSVDTLNEHYTQHGISDASIRKVFLNVCVLGKLEVAQWLHTKAPIYNYRRVFSEMVGNDPVNKVSIDLYKLVLLWSLTSKYPVQIKKYIPLNHLISGKRFELIKWLYDTAASQDVIINLHINNYQYYKTALLSSEISDDTDLFINWLCETQPLPATVEVLYYLASECNVQNKHEMINRAIEMVKLTTYQRSLGHLIIMAVNVRNFNLFKWLLHPRQDFDFRHNDNTLIKYLASKQLLDYVKYMIEKYPFHYSLSQINNSTEYCITITNPVISCLNKGYYKLAIKACKLQMTTEEIKGECSICLNENSAEYMCRTPCGHVFCLKCIITWMFNTKDIGARCPYCRAELTLISLKCYRNISFSVTVASAVAGAIDDTNKDEAQLESSNKRFKPSETTIL